MSEHVITFSSDYSPEFTDEHPTGELRWLIKSPSQSVLQQFWSGTVKKNGTPIRYIREWRDVPFVFEDQTPPGQIDAQ